jgi:hypothetical protein
MPKIFHFSIRRKCASTHILHWGYEEGVGEEAKSGFAQLVLVAVGCLFILMTSPL